MFLVELFSCCKKGELFDSVFQYQYDNASQLHNPVIEKWLIKFLYQSHYKAHIHNNINEEIKEIHNFLDYHLKKYNERYSQTDDIAFLTTFEFIIFPIAHSRKHIKSKLSGEISINSIIHNWIKSKDVEYPKIIYKEKNTLRKWRDTFSVCEFNAEQKSIYQYRIYKDNYSPTENDIRNWILGVLYTKTPHNKDLGNAANKQKDINEFLDFHLSEYKNKYNLPNDTEFALLIYNLINTIDESFALTATTIEYIWRVNQMVYKWCLSKLPNDYIESSDCVIISDDTTLLKTLTKDKLNELYNLLISIKCILPNTDKQAFEQVFMNMKNNDNSHYIIWRRSKQLLRELLLGFKNNNIAGLKKDDVTDNAIKNVVPIFFRDSDNNPFTLTKPREFLCSESDAIRNFLATL